MEIFWMSESRRNFLEGQKRKVDIFIETKNIFNPYFNGKEQKRMNMPWTKRTKLSSFFFLLKDLIVSFKIIAMDKNVSSIK
jgi:hypothetical protein